MESPAPIPTGRPERILRFVLLALLWSAWLTIRAAWALSEWLFSREGRAWCGKWVLGLGLAVAIALLPKVAGLAWGRIMLQDAAEILAMQADGRDAREIATALRRRAFVLGFTDIILQDEAIRVELQSAADGTTCSIEVDFQHRVDLYGWTAPPLRIHLKVEKPVFQRAVDKSLEEFIS